MSDDIQRSRLAGTGFGPERLVGAAALCGLALLSGCGTFNSGSSSSTTAGGGTSTGTGTPAAQYSAVVFVGDSLTAGFQNGSLLDSQQPNGYAPLVAKQANFSITLPLMAPPGVPAVLQLVSVGPPPVVTQASGTSTGRDNGAAQPTDLAVPGHKVHDILYYTPPAVPTSGEDIITELVLGFPVGNNKAQAAEAVALKPTTIFLWAGSDDALQADETGMPSSMTPLASFTTDFTQLISTLKGTGANLIVGNIPDVTAVPYLTPAATIVAEVAAATKLSSSTVASGLGISTGDLVNSQGLTDIQAEEKTVAGGGSLSPLPDGDVLTTTEIAAVQSTVDAYNQVIQQQVASAGGTLVDMHAYFATLQSGVAVNGSTATTGFLGGLFSLDGIHPTNTGYALLANQFIAALNTKFSSSIPMVDVNTVAASDPLFGANIKPTAMMRIPTSAAAATGRVMQEWYKVRR
jgi:lysophospholipase L1-like esterase